MCKTLVKAINNLIVDFDPWLQTASTKNHCKKTGIIDVETPFRHANEGEEVLISLHVNTYNMYSCVKVSGNTFRN